MGQQLNTKEKVMATETGQKMTLSEEKILFVTGDQISLLDADINVGVTFQSKLSVTLLAADGGIEMEAKNISIEGESITFSAAPASVSLKDDTVHWKAPKVTV